ncbi:MAG: YcbK family protein [Hyphomicrobiaceae bacterium]|nr:YcbK family protein [Hyphomicrobiaceae bacterium]
MHSRGIAILAGVALLTSAIIHWTPRLAAALPQTRTISLHNIHTKETITVEYKKDGKYVPTAMDQIDWVLRDWRKDEKTRMEPELIDLLWEVHTELGSREPIHIISGYRSRATNNMLRETRGGQASQSRHILGRAADVHFPDVPVRRLRYSALVRERGGVGYYPTSAIPFVHIDIDRVRAWPRLPRYELALLFPDGRTRHIPADGQPLTPADVHAARSQHRDLSAQVAAYHELRNLARGPARVAVADAGAAPRTAPAPAQRVAMKSPEPARTQTPPAFKSPAALPPKLVAEPRLVDRPSQPAGRASDEDRLKLAQLAALASFPDLRSASPEIVPASFSGDEPASARDPARTGSSAGRLPEPLPRHNRFGWGAGFGSGAGDSSDTAWAVAPAYDDEHPEELSYRPFPIVPYLTETASPDDPALARMEHPDVAMTLELLDQAGELPPMSLRPGPQSARLLWAQQFRGEAVPLSNVFGEVPPAAASGIAKRAVRLSAR